MGRDRQSYTAFLNALLEFLACTAWWPEAHTPFHSPGWRLAADAVALCRGRANEDANKFFRTLYQTIAAQLEPPDSPLFGFEAREHTAQVNDDQAKAARTTLSFQRARKKAVGRQH